MAKDEARHGAGFAGMLKRYKVSAQPFNYFSVFYFAFANYVLTSKLRLALNGNKFFSLANENLELRAAAESGACEGKLAIAKRAKQLGYDAIHDTVHEMAKDEARQLWQWHALF